MPKATEPLNTLFVRAASALYGASWQSDVAESLSISLRTVQRIAAGQAPVREGMVHELLALAIQRQRALNVAIKELATLIASMGDDNNDDDGSDEVSLPNRAVSQRASVPTVEVGPVTVRLRGHSNYAGSHRLPSPDPTVTRAAGSRQNIATSGETPAEARTRIVPTAAQKRWFDKQVDRFLKPEITKIKWMLGEKADNSASFLTAEEMNHLPQRQLMEYLDRREAVVLSTPGYGWAEERGIHPAIARAIHVVASAAGKSPDHVFTMPTKDEEARVWELTKEYLDEDRADRNIHNSYGWNGTGAILRP